ncbi:MAG: extracellular solute-binding protein [Clostridia bacterium]|nr:extracellular solute-binding protein [Clostridia bacterium]
MGAGGRMPTIDDIAKLANVSHGTVSNVLNKKGNVSVAKIKRVEEAARELGFKLNAQARLLRQGQSNRVVLIVPHCKISRYADLHAGLSFHLSNYGYTLEYLQTGDYPHQEQKVLEEAVSFSPAAIIVVSAQVKPIPKYFNSVPIVYFERVHRILEERIYAVSFDLEAAGIEIAKRCILQQKRQIALFCGLRCYTDSDSFSRGVLATLEKHGCDCNVYSGDYHMNKNLAFSLCQRLHEYDAIITSDLEKAQSLEDAIAFYPQSKLPPIYTIASSSIIPSSHFICYELNYRYAGKKIASMIKSMQSGKAVEPSTVLPQDGFSLPITLEIPRQYQRLNMLSIANPTSAALQKLLPSFTQKTGIEVKLVEVTYSELYNEAKHAMQGSIYDLIRLDMAWLGAFGSNIYQPIDLQEDPFSKILDGFSQALPREYFYAGRTCYSLPFDISVQLLLYRKDLFDDALIKRKFYEMQKQHLQVPKTYEEYYEVARFFTRRFNADSPTSYGTSLVFGSAIVAACDFLPRLKAAGLQSFFDDQGKVHINTELVQKTLASYIESFSCTNQALNYWWQDATEEFSEGKTAMIPVFSNYASTLVNNPNSKLIGNIGYAPLPGNKPLLGGGILGITKSCTKMDAAKTFLAWLYEQKTANLITYLGGYIHSASLEKNPDIAELYPWTRELKQALASGWRSEPTMPPRITEIVFEEILGGAVRSAVTGLLSIEEALSDAQEKYNSLYSSQ